MADQIKSGPIKAGAIAPPKAELSEQEVIAYLRSHPRLLLNNPGLLSELSPETRFETETVVVDMQKFVVDRLRRQVDDLKTGSDRLVNTTRANMSLVERSMECALALLYARDFAELAQIMADDLPVHLGVDAVSIAFETDTLPADCGSVVKALPAGAVNDLIGTGATHRIRAETEGEAALYGSSAGLVRSDALVALEAGEGLPPGIFAVGCRTAGHFDPEQGTELIAFLGHVARYAVGRWWTLKL